MDKHAKVYGISCDSPEHLREHAASELLRSPNAQDLQARLLKESLRVKEASVGDLQKSVSAVNNSRIIGKNELIDLMLKYDGPQITVQTHIGTQAANTSHRNLYSVNGADSASKVDTISKLLEHELKNQTTS